MTITDSVLIFLDACYNLSDLGVPVMMTGINCWQVTWRLLSVFCISAVSSELEDEVNPEDKQLREDVGVVEGLDTCTNFWKMAWA